MACITSSIAAGNRLDTSMPIYPMSSEDLADLIELQKLLPEFTLRGTLGALLLENYSKLSYLIDDFS